jgi:hypothetical protein
MIVSPFGKKILLQILCMILVATPQPTRLLLGWNALKDVLSKKRVPP